MGHKPSATAEKHYKVRPLDLLRMWHTKIESWFLEQAGIKLEEVQPGLRVVGTVRGNKRKTKRPADEFTPIDKYSRKISAAFFITQRYAVITLVMG